MSQIAHFQVEKWESSLPWEGGGGTPPPPQLGRYAPSQRLRPPKKFGLITPLIHIICKCEDVR